MSVVLNQYEHGPIGRGGGGGGRQTCGLLGTGDSPPKNMEILPVGGRGRTHSAGLPGRERGDQRERRPGGEWSSRSPKENARKERNGSDCSPGRDWLCP